MSIYTSVEIISYSNTNDRLNPLDLHIRRNYKLFKLSIQNRKRGNLHISRNYKLFKQNMDKLDYEIYTSVEIISYSNNENMTYTRIDLQISRNYKLFKHHHGILQNCIYKLVEIISYSNFDLSGINQ